MIIYVAECRKTNKVYIGQTVQTLHKRRIAHHTEARNGSDTHFHRALRKYGESAFDWFILLDGVCDRAILDSAERSYIVNTDKKSLYNIEPGGTRKGNVLAASTRNKMRIARLGKPMKEKTKDAIRQALLHHYKDKHKYTNEVLKYSFKDATSKFGISQTQYYRIKNNEKPNRRTT